MNENTLASAAAENEAAPPARFDTLPLDPKLLKAVADQGYAFMTPIQAKAIPIVLEGRDVMGAAQTGTGKTAAFSIPLLQKMMRHENASASPARHPERALVLAPTRELADQVEYVVLDEADRMLDIGFLPDLQRILSYLPKQRQTLLFSATFSPEIKRLANSYLQDPILVEVARPNATASTVEQRFISATDDDKRAIVLKVLKDRNIQQAIVFVNSKLGAARLARSFERDGLRTAALHGDKSQDERLKSLAAFKAGEVDLLVATDVAARGLDIADLPAVFNFDVPFNAEDYVHRIGRTGRAGASGMAVTLVTRDDTRLMSDIEKLIKKTVELEAIDLDEGRPPRRPARTWEPEAVARPVPAPVRRSEPRVARDPFFDRPYEASVSTEPAAWERNAPASAQLAPGRLSPNIRAKRKVAVLLGGFKG
jgi:ATP-dependent RNA helicase RhlE